MSQSWTAVTDHSPEVFEDVKVAQLHSTSATSVVAVVSGYIVKETFSAPLPLLLIPPLPSLTTSSLAKKDTECKREQALSAHEAGALLRVRRERREHVH